MRQRGVIPLGLILYAVAGLAILAALWGLHRHGVNSGRAEIQAKWDKASRDQRAAEEKKITTAATKLEVANAEARVVTRTVTVQVDKIVERPIYRNVCLDADGLCVANAAIRGASPDSCQPGKPVPRAPSTDGRDRGLSVALDYRDLVPLP